LDNAKIETIEFVVSGTLQSQSSEHCESLFKDVKKPIREEADVRLIQHALHATLQGGKRCVLLSNDTDVMVLGLHFYES
jgi:hypothetical protein